MSIQIFSKNGEILPIEQAVISIDDTAFTYGFGVYENLKVRNGVLYFPELHAKRLLRSARVIELPDDLTEEKIIKNLNDLKLEIKEESYNFKVLLVGNKKGKSDLYILALAPLYPPSNYYAQGVKVVTYSGERLFPQAKTLNMLMSFLAYKKAKEQNAYDALLIDNQSNIREGTRTNIIYIMKEKIYAPPLELVLEGVTLCTVIDALKQKNINVTQRELKLSEVTQCDAIMLLSTSTKIIPISQIDSEKIPIHEKTKEVMKIYDDYLNEYKKTQNP